MSRSRGRKKTYSLILVEGDTEEYFYGLVKKKYFKSLKSKVINLKGNWNIDTKVLNAVESFARDHCDVKFSVIVCIDRESRSDKAPINMEMIRAELQCLPNIDHDHVCLFEAIQDLESWFFHDMDGIYSFLRTEKSKRKPQKYKPVEKLNNKDLAKLFKSNGREYKKGFASSTFIDGLDLQIIRSQSSQFNQFCCLMEKLCKQQST